MCKNVTIAQSHIGLVTTRQTQRVSTNARRHTAAKQAASDDTVRKPAVFLAAAAFVVLAAADIMRRARLYVFVYYVKLPTFCIHFLFSGRKKKETFRASLS